MTISRIKISPNGPIFSRFVAGFWRMTDWQLNTAQSLALIEEYLELGITTMDHADIYGYFQCEALFGAALASHPTLRDYMEIVTKCGIKPVDSDGSTPYMKYYDTSHRHIIESANQSLQNLRTDYLDLLLIHRPDPLMQADEIAEAFYELKKEGKVLYFGVSNFSSGQFDLLQSRLDFELVTNQLEISPLQMNYLHNGTLDHCQMKKVSPMAWSCLAGAALLTDNSEQTKRLRVTLNEIMEETMADNIEQVIYAWILQLPSKPLPILGTGKLDRVKSYLKAESMKLTRHQWFKIWQSSMGHSVP